MASNEIPIEKKLSEIFQDAYDTYNSFDKCYEPTNSSDFQMKIKKCIGLFEDATRLVSLTGMFSTNENYEEVSTNDLKYFLLPYFLGELSLKICSGNRKDIIEAAEIYFNDFLKRCADYGFYEPESRIAKVDHGNQQQLDEIQELTLMAQSRNLKLQQYREKKELKDQIEQLKLVMEREYMDDSFKRDFYIKLITSSIWDSQEELKSIETEKQILDHMSKMGNDERKPVKSSPLKPIIITRDVVQQAVFGRGYPSLPTLTVQDFYNQRVAEGIFPDPTKDTKHSSKVKSLQDMAEIDIAERDEQEEAEKEAQIENDDEEYLARARAMDEFKDDVRRGEGNRYNRS